MNPACMVHANKSLAFRLYDFRLMTCLRRHSPQSVGLLSTEVRKNRSREALPELSGCGCARTFADRSDRGVNGKILFTALQSAFLFFCERIAPDLIYFSQR
jgi:hypothetical protein